MKQIEILLHNKEKILLIDIPVGATNLDLSVMGIHYKYLDEDCRIDLDNADVMFEILGEYNPITGTISFPEKVKEEWVERKKSSWGTSYFIDYITNPKGKMHHGGFDIAKQSFLSLLKSETEKMWPLKENPAIEPNHLDYKEEKFKGELTFKHGMLEKYSDDYDSWMIREYKVMPKRFIVLLIK